MTDENRPVRRFLKLSELQDILNIFQYAGLRPRALRRASGNPNRRTGPVACGSPRFGGIHRRVLSQDQRDDRPRTARRSPQRRVKGRHALRGGPRMLTSSHLSPSNNRTPYGHASFANHAREYRLIDHRGSFCAPPSRGGPCVLVAADVPVQPLFGSSRFCRSMKSAMPGTVKATCPYSGE